MSKIVFDGWGWRHSVRKNPAVEGFSLTIEAGERVAILGPSGAGKSTILQGLAGVLGSGEDGSEYGTLSVEGDHPAKVRGKVGLLLQDPEAQIMLSRVGDDIAFGAESLGVERDEIWRRVREAKELVGLDVPLDHDTAKLSGGQQQRMALAGVLAMKPSVIALDEPTANLDPVGSRLVVESVANILDAQPSVTLVLVDHEIERWVDVLTRVIVINKDGQIIRDDSPQDVFATEVELLQEMGVWVPGFRVKNHRLPKESNRVLITGENLSYGYGDTPVGIDYDVALKGEIITAITGKNGAGKTTLALTLAGLLPPIDGVVSAKPLKGKLSSDRPIQWKSADLAVRISMVFQQPEYQFVARTVAEELQIGPRLDTAPEADELLERLGLQRLAKAHPMSLSGGEKRRLSVGTALATGSPLIILDEPTFGQDYNSWKALVSLMGDAKDDGRGVVCITHDEQLINSIADSRIELGGR